MALTDITKCKAYLGAAYTDTTDDFLTMLVDEVQAEIENYCNRKFDIHSYTAEQHTSMHKIFVNNYPIKTVEAIRRVAPDVFNIAYTAEDAMNTFRIHPSYIEMIDFKYVTMSNKIMWMNKEESYVEVDYTAGYEQNEIPNDLSFAATKLVAWEYKESRENRLGIESESVGAVKYTYSKKDMAIPATISSVLDRYSKVRV